MAKKKLDNKRVKESETEKEDLATADHPDADKDMALIKKMIDQHLGDKTKDMNPQEMETLETLGHEAYQAHKEMGKKEDEAMKCAGEALELAHHMHQKKKAKESENEGEGDDKKKKLMPKAKDDSDTGDGDDADSEESEGEKESENECKKESEGETKESNRMKDMQKKLLEATGRIAALEAETKKSEVAKYVDTKLKESKQPMSITKKFLEAAGELKNKEDFDGKWKVFLSAVQDARANLDFGLLMEKAVHTESGERTDSTKGFDFSSCAD